ncbi:hypothetical protein AB0D04_01950 [Streptomyces sp. NPDC048483]|uniref:hypothetical protein n=1 Tax=Streptomyces sp. NPDC048483 TaxID=3154927 RepID=UPI003416A09F
MNQLPGPNSTPSGPSQQKEGTALSQFGASCAGVPSFLILAVAAAAKEEGELFFLCVALTVFCVCVAWKKRAAAMEERKAWAWIRRQTADDYEQYRAMYRSAAALFQNLHKRCIELRKSIDASMVSEPTMDTIAQSRAADILCNALDGLSKQLAAGQKAAAAHKGGPLWLNLQTVQQTAATIGRATAELAPTNNEKASGLTDRLWTGLSVLDELHSTTHR